MSKYKSGRIQGVVNAKWTRSLAIVQACRETKSHSGSSFDLTSSSLLTTPNLNHSQFHL